jgi:hypothetical protein
MDRPSPPNRERQRLKPREQGDLGELSAMEWLASKGATIAIPVFHSPDWDLIAELAGTAIRIQVKTSTACDERGRFTLRLATSGGNQSWNRIIKRFDASRYDYLFALVGDGRRWFIPSHAIEGSYCIVLGGVKYSEFEVEPGAAIVAGPTSRIVEAPTRGSAGVGEPGLAVNQVPSLLRGFESLLPHHHPPEVPARPSARTRISANHQITIPLGPFRAAGLEIAQAIRVTAVGDGHLLLDRIEIPAETSETSDAALF